MAIDGLYANFGRRLHQARRDVGLTQEEVAARTGLSRPSISNIEKGRQHITLHVAVGLAGAVGRTVDELLSSPGSGYAIPERKLRRLAEQDREVVVKVITGATNPVGGRARRTDESA